MYDNLIVKDGGSLTLSSCKLVFYTTSKGIYVNTGGSLTLDNCEITTDQDTFAYEFVADGVVDISSSKIYNVYSPTTLTEDSSGGIIVKDTRSSITDTEIYSPGPKAGIGITVDGCSPTISGNNIYDFEYGVLYRDAVYSTSPLQTFTDGTSSKIIHMGPDGTGTFDIELPSNSMVTSATLDISGIERDGNQKLSGDYSLDQFANSMSVCDDLNADGYPELIVGVPSHDEGANTDRGKVIIYKGTATGFDSTPLSTTINPTVAAEQKFGYAVAYIGNMAESSASDPEIAISSPFYDVTTPSAITNAGKVEIFSVDSLGALTPKHTIYGSQANQFLGLTLENIGDYNADGYSDLAIGSPLWDTASKTDAGKVDIYEGDVTPASIAKIFTIEGTETQEHLGMGLAGALDVDCDGFNDLLIGGDNAGQSYASDVHLFLGYFSDTTYSNTPDLTITSGSNGDRFGASISTAGDLNGDNYDDLVIGAPEWVFNGQKTGAVEVYYGSHTGIDTSEKDVIYGQNEMDLFGYSVSGGKDTNMDGYDDLVVNVLQYDGQVQDQGKVLVYQGSSDGISFVPSNQYWGNGDDSEFGRIAGSYSNLDNYWKLDESSWNGVQDEILDSVSSGHGMAANGVVNQYGKFGRCADIDGSNDYIALKENFQSADYIPSMTSACWFQTTDSGGSYSTNWALLDYDRSEYFNYYIHGSSGVVEFSTKGGGSIQDQVGSTAVNDGDWHFALVTYSSSGKKIYVDGILDASTTAHSGASLGTGNVRYGFIGDGSEATSFDGSRNNKYYDGTVDEVIYYSQEFSANDALTMYIDSIVSSPQSDMILMDVNQDGAMELVLADPLASGSKGVIDVYNTEPLYVPTEPAATYIGGASDYLDRGFGVGDYDDDGIDDFLIANYENDPSSITIYGGNTGESFSQLDSKTSTGKDRLGFSVAHGSFAGSTQEDVAIGIPLDGTYGKVIVETNGDLSTVDWTVSGTSGSNFGYQVGFGDINGDGYDDLIATDCGDGSNKGYAKVFFGGSSPSTTADLTLEEEGLTDYFYYGKSLAIGDFNNDGYDDIVIGSPEYGDDDGKIYLYYGGSTPDAVADEVLEGTYSGMLGTSVSNVGDLDGDGYLDLATGSPFYVGSPSEGVIDVHYGSSSGLLGSDWQIIADAPVDEFGKTISPGVDLNLDGFSDFIMGSPGASSIDPLFPEGKITVAFGSPEGVIVSDFYGSNPKDEFGSFVNVIGDVNGDDYPDHIVGSSNYVHSSTNLGKVEVMTYTYPIDPSLDIGSDGDMEFISDSRLSGTHTLSGLRFVEELNSHIPEEDEGMVTITCELAAKSGIFLVDSMNIQFTESIQRGVVSNIITDCSYGIYVKNSRLPISSNQISDCDNGIYYKNSDTSSTSSIDLFSGNSKEAMVTAEPSGSTNLRVPYGATVTDVSFDIESVGTPETIDLIDDEFFGASFDMNGDMNGDGYFDLVVGQPGDQYNDLGELVFLEGSSTGFADILSGTTYTGSSDENLGTLVRFVGDTNGDGYDDLAVIAPNLGSPVMYVFEGQATGIFGGPHIPVVISAPDSLLDYGHSLIGIGDMNKDGFDDIAIGAPGTSTAGEVYIYLGSATGISASNKVTLTEGETTFGTSIAFAGDLNTDGCSDLVVGCPGYGSNKGAVYVYLGSKDVSHIPYEEQLLEGVLALGQFGYSIVGGMDIVADGFPDIVISSPGDNSGDGMIEIFTGDTFGFNDEVYQEIKGKDGFGQKLMLAELDGDDIPEIGVMNSYGDLELIYIDGSKQSEIIKNPVVDATDLIGYWEMDETSWVGTTDEVVDSSGTGYHGTIINTPNTIPGYFERAGDLDGVNEGINFGDIAEMDQADYFTYATWFYRDTDVNDPTNHNVDNMLIAQSSNSANDNFELGTDGSNVEIYLDRNLACFCVIGVF